jgi:hypothetical protein
MTTATDTVSGPSAGSGLESRIATIGGDLGRVLQRILDAIPGGPFGPAELARRLGVDKVLTSRTLKAVRNKDPLAVIHLAPGPEPLRRLARAAGRAGAPPATVAEVEAAVDAFESLIRQEAGDRSSLNAIISAWLPEARHEFELRRKQSAFKAMSQLKGAMADTNLATVMVHPSRDESKLDVVWVTGLLGLHRLRPGAGVKFATRRITDGNGPRRPTSLDGVPVDDLDGVRLEEFCSSPPPKLNVVPAGEVVHYTLADTGFGPRSAVDLVFAEANIAELPRYIPRDSGRKAYYFAEISTPAKALLFDVYVHDDVYPGSDPALHIYDTALDGVASVNDAARNIDRIDMDESIQPLGARLGQSRSTDVPDYARLLRHVTGKMAWDAGRFRGYRCRVDYPIYGTQVVMAFDAPEA